MKQKTRFTTALVIAALTLGMVSTASADVADDAEDNATVTVQVTSKIAVDVTPEQLDYGSLEPGASQTFANNGPESGYSSIEIENIGSENISQVWLNSTVPSERPFGSGVTSAYDAGNFIKAKSDDSTAQEQVSYSTYINRKEWNESSPLRYVFTPDSSLWDYGRFRNGQNEFFWAVKRDGAGACDTAADSFRLGNSAHNESFTGSTDFTSSGDWTGFTPSQVDTSNKYVVTGVQPDIPGVATDPQYDVVLECDNANGETTATFTRYNVKADGVNDLTEEGGQALHLINATQAANTDQMLQPGENVAANTSVQVPQGVVSNTGSGYSGTLRVFVNSLVT